MRSAVQWKICHVYQFFGSIKQISLDYFSKHFNVVVFSALKLVTSSNGLGWWKLHFLEYEMIRSWAWKLNISSCAPRDRLEPTLLKQISTLLAEIIFP